MLYGGVTFGQNQTDSITLRKKTGTIYVQNGKILTPKQLLAITKVNPEAYSLMKKAKSNYDAANVFSFAGGFLIGWQVGAAIGGRDANWGVAGLGAGLVVVAIPFSVAYSKHVKNAVSNYNNGLSQAGLRKINFSTGLCAHGIGLKVTF